MINIWSNEYANYPDLTIPQCMHILKLSILFHT
jgi:hypothetical protein